MTTEQKQFELNRIKSILFTTIDYLIDHPDNTIVYDEQDPLLDYYQQHKIQTQKYYEQRRLDRLQQRLSRLLEQIIGRPDLNLESYIKVKTGYDFNVLENYREHIHEILLNNEGEGDKDSNNVTLKKQSGYTEIIRKEEKDGIEITHIHVSTGPKPTYFQEDEVISPDGKRRLIITKQTERKYSSTRIDIYFPGAIGTIYQAEGIRDDVTARWKDNSTIVVDTNKRYSSQIQPNTVRSFDDLISIEYKFH